MLSWGKAVILGACCDICLYMLHIAIYACTYLSVCYQHKTVVNIDIIDLNAFVE